MPVDPGAAALSQVRRYLLALLVFGLVGTAVELLLLGHYEDTWQVVPLVLIVGTLGAIVAHVATGTPNSVRALVVMMCLLVVSGALGIALHYKGNLEFQIEMDRTQSSWQLFKKVMQAKAPPALAPGLMTQLGLLGLVYTYRHPALGRGPSVREGV